MSDPSLASAALSPMVRPAIRFRRLRLRGMNRDYDIDFREPSAEVTDGANGSDEGRSVRPLSIIAGEISTGKTTILEFIDYCLGAGSHPTHPEVLRQVRTAQLELELGGQTHVIERSVGEPSTSAIVWKSTLDALHGSSGPPGERRPIRPPGDPASLSSLLLSHCGLEGVLLREAPTNPESKTDPLSFRDLMWICFMRNERLDDKNLLFESGHMRSLKLRQVVDVTFGVHDYRAVELGQRVDELIKVVAQSKSDLAATKSFVDEQQPNSRVHLELQLQAARDQLVATDATLAELDQRARSATDFAVEVRQRHADAAARARRSSALVRDRDTLLRRLVPLRAQYAEDVRKLTLLAEAHTLFDPLRVSVCSACFSRLTTSPEADEGQCSLCHSELPPDASALTLGGARAGNGDGSSREPRSAIAPAPPESSADSGDATSARLEVAAELRSTQARLKELAEYVDSLDAGLEQLRQQLVRDEESERQAAQELDAATSVAVTPFLAERDGLAQRRQLLIARSEEAEAGLRLLAGLERRAELVELHERNLRTAREQLAAVSTLTDRREVVAAVSQRFAKVLADFKYPKLERPFIADDLVPHVRELRYTEASSGARTLISLAWILSIFEIAWERSAAQPGFLMIDSPQKNLGAHVGSSPDEFADVGIVRGIYNHIRDWLSGPGSGAQLIMVDNSPPESEAEDVVIRFSRDPLHEPYGLISDELG